MTNSPVGTVAGQEVRARVDDGGVDSEVPEHRRRGDIDTGSLVQLWAAGPLRKTDGDEGAVTLEGDDGRIAGLVGLPEGITAASPRPAALWRTRAALRASCGRLEWERDELRFVRGGPCTPGTWLSDRLGSSAAIRSSSFFLGCRGDGHRCCDAEGEDDRGECRPRSGLAAGEVTEREARADRGVSGGSGDDADREWAQEQGAEDGRDDPGDDERHAVSVGQCGGGADVRPHATRAAIAEWRAGLGWRRTP